MPGHEPEGDHLELAAQRLVRLPGRVDLGHHRLAGARVERAHGRLVHALEVRRGQAVAGRSGHRPDARDVRAHLHAQLAQVRLGERAGGHPRRGLARGCALEHVAHVGVPELLDPGEVGVAGARKVDLVHLGLHRPGVHPLLPVLVVAVLDPHRHRAAERAPVADPGRHLRAVLLDLHPAAAAVPELAPGEVAVDVLGAQLEAGREALDDGGEPRAVGFARGYEAQRHGAHTLLMRVRAPVGGGTAVGGRS